MERDVADVSRNDSWGDRREVLKHKVGEGLIPAFRCAISSATIGLIGKVNEGVNLVKCDPAPQRRVVFGCH